MRTIAVDDSVACCVCKPVCTRLSPSKQLNGSRSYLEWRLLDVKEQWGTVFCDSSDRPKVVGDQGSGKTLPTVA